MGAHLAVIGKTGQLAKALQREITDTNFTATFYDRNALDLSASKESIANFMINLPHCDGLILAAAYTAVDKAETDQKTAMAVNGKAPGIIADYCHSRNIPLVHISTDYVFNGQATRPYKVSNTADPLNRYGHSKRAGELNIQESGCQHAIIRTSWVYDGVGKNFLTTMLRLASERNEISVVNDQWGRPTYAGHLAKSVFMIAHGLISKKNGYDGIFHVTNSGPVISWADFAEAIFRAQNLDTQILPISTSEFPTPAQRPSYSALDTSKFESLFAYNLPNWQEGLSAALAERF